MKNTFLFLIICFTIIFGVGCCDCELPSDEELRHEIIGTWENETCEYPYHTDPYNSYSFPVGTVTFNSDGSFLNGLNNVDISICRDSCGIDSVSTGFSSYYCTCGWYIDDGNLYLTSDSLLGQDYFGTKYPIICFETGEKFILGQTTSISGHAVENNKCFKRL
jgi:hypothetical protein